MYTLEIATSSHIGGRDEQQDSVGSWSNEHATLVVVADGVGGNIGGAAASQTVIQCTNDYWEACAGVFESPENDLTTIAKNADSTINTLNPGERRSPASTIVALYINQNHAHWIHSGDSRLYWLRSGQELSRTRDHSVVQLLLEQGKITPEEINTHPDKGRILKTLGASSFKGVDYGSCEFQGGDAFCLCSDGYWESMPADAKILPPKPGNLSLDAYTDEQVRQAVENNGVDSDNTTLAIVYAKIASEPTSAPSNIEASNSTSPLKTALTLFFYTFIILDIILIFYFLFSK